MYPRQCPKCKFDFQGQEIAEEKQELYGVTHFTKVIGLSDGNSIRRWQCPECAHIWDRTEPLVGGVYRSCNIILEKF